MGNPKERIEKIISLSCLLMTCKQIAERCDCSTVNVAKILSRRGYPPLFATGHCPRHVRYGLELGKTWNGGKYRNDGYVLVRAPWHPRAVKGYVPEHIMVMERVLGRPVTDPEIVHHLNGIRDDNRPENLEVLRNRAAHGKLHAKLKLEENS